MASVSETIDEGMILDINEMMVRINNGEPLSEEEIKYWNENAPKLNTATSRTMRQSTKNEIETLLITTPFENIGQYNSFIRKNVPYGGETRISQLIKLNEIGTKIKNGQSLSEEEISYWDKNAAKLNGALSRLINENNTIDEIGFFMSPETKLPFEIKEYISFIIKNLPYKRKTTLLTAPSMVRTERKFAPPAPKRGGRGTISRGAPTAVGVGRGIGGTISMGGVGRGMGGAISMGGGVSTSGRRVVPVPIPIPLLPTTTTAPTTTAPTTTTPPTTATTAATVSSITGPVVLPRFPTSVSVPFTAVPVSLAPRFTILPEAKELKEEEKETGKRGTKRKETTLRKRLTTKLRKF